MAPYLVLFMTFTVVPAVLGIWISLHRFNYLLPRQPFSGLQNYIDLVTPGSAVFSLFWDSMKASAIFVATSVPLLIVIPLLVALLLNKRIRGRTFFRAVFFAPFVLGVAVVSNMWRYLLDPNIGLVNQLLNQVGIHAFVGWTTSLPWAWISLVGVTVWWTLGFNAVIFLAGLQNIDRQLYDAADVDGASRWQSFRYVTLPGLRPVTFFILIETTLASANMFGQSLLITHGAPGTSTQTAIMYIASEGLGHYQMGSAAAMSYVLALFLALISVMYFRTLGRRDPGFRR